jgi:aryl-alcohol dehydrogenase-like predicted oxidoreductase
MIDNLIAKESLVELGQSGVRISPMGIGAWAWGDRFFWGYGQGYSEDDVRHAFDASLESGINFFDTAEVYGSGRSERLLGQFAKAGVNTERPRLIIATKFFPFPWRLGAGSLKKALKRSLERLQVKRVDLYQIHSPYSPRSIETWAEALGEAVQEGFASAVGVSNYNLDQMRRAHDILLRANIPLASNQVEYSLLNRNIERNGLLKECQERRISLIAYSPIGKGMLTGKYSVQNPPPGVRARIYNRSRLEKIQPLVKLLVEIGRRHGSKTPGQVALNWTMCKGTLPIPGVKDAQQAFENTGALGWRLDESEIAALDDASIDYR